MAVGFQGPETRVDENKLTDLGQVTYDSRIRIRNKYVHDVPHDEGSCFRRTFF